MFPGPCVRGLCRSDRVRAPRSVRKCGLPWSTPPPLGTWRETSWAMKRLLRTLWRSTAPIHRTVSSRLERFVATCVARALETHNPTRELAEEVGLVLDAVVTEQ